MCCTTMLFSSASKLATNSVRALLASWFTSLWESDDRVVRRSITGRRQEVSGAEGVEDGSSSESVRGGHGARLCLQLWRRVDRVFTSDWRTLQFFLGLEKLWSEMVSAGSETLFFFVQIT